MERTVRAAAFAALFLCLTVHQGFADDVTLTSRDGKIALSGTLLGFDGEYYRIESIYGELTVDGSGVLCDGPACPNLQDFVAEVSVSGSAAMGAVLMPALIEGFAQFNGFAATRDTVDETHFIYELTDKETGKIAARFFFRATNTDEGFADLLANEADMVMALREIEPLESQRALEAGMGDMRSASQTRVLALDGIVPIVSPVNPVRDISPLDLARAYAGEIANWTDLGGPDAPIVLHAPSLETGLGQAVEDRVVQPSNLALSAAIIRHLRGSDLADAVARDPFALGIVGFAEIGPAQALALTGPCRRNLAATRRSIKTADYPVTAPLFLYLPARRLPLVVQEFLAFTRSPAAQIVIRRAGFVDQSLEEIPVDEQGERFVNAVLAAGPETSLEELQRMAALLNSMHRLTVSFRFESGSARLDAQSQSNIDYLALGLKQGDFDARRLLFVGFSDGEGPAEANRAMSLRRAEAVQMAVQRAATTADLSQVEMQVDAFGEAMPMACDNSDWGRHANRRVEVWVR